MQETTISALSVAASLAVGIGGTAGIAVSGAGALANNVILTKTNAYVANSTLVAGLVSEDFTTGSGVVALTLDDTVRLTDGYSNGGDAGKLYRYTGENASLDLGLQDYSTGPWQRIGNVILDARNLSSINATIVAASAAIGGGGAAGVGASIGVAIAENMIGWNRAGERIPAEVQAYVLNSSIDAAGDLIQTAQATESIDAVVVSGSVAVGIGGSAGIAASGAGSSADNKIATLVKAYIDGDGDTGIVADRITLTAYDNSSIDSVVVGASLAAGLSGGLGAALSIGVSLARNEISNEVEAYINAADDVTSRVGDIVLDAAVLESGHDNRYTTASGAVELEKGETVQVLVGHNRGGDVGAVYRYVGEDYNYTSTMGVVDIKQGDTVRLLGGYHGGGDAGSLYIWNGGNANLDLGNTLDEGNHNFRRLRGGLSGSGRRFRGRGRIKRGRCGSHQCHSHQNQRLRRAQYSGKCRRRPDRCPELIVD
jgi:hypothetical protein